MMKQADRDRLIVENVGMVNTAAWCMARKLNNHIHLDDLRSDAQLGLVKAAARFDKSMGCKFSTYALKRMNGEMLDGLRVRSFVPKWEMEKLKRGLPCDIRELTHLGANSLLVAKEHRLGYYAELEDELEFLLGCLTEKERRMVEMYYYSQQDMKDIAVNEGVTVAAISYRIKKAIAKMWQAYMKSRKEEVA